MTRNLIFGFLVVCAIFFAFTGREQSHRSRAIRRSALGWLRSER